MQFDHYEITCFMENDVVPDQLASSEADLDIHCFSIEYLSCSILFQKELTGADTLVQHSMGRCYTGLCALSVLLDKFYFLWTNKLWLLNCSWVSINFLHH